MAARNEDQALQHMLASYEQLGRKLSGVHKQWVREKVKALDVARVKAAEQTNRSPDVVRLKVLELGVGDMDYWRALPWMPDMVEYHGVDGCEDILADRAEEFPECTFYGAKFSDVAGGDVLDIPAHADVLVALDILYHLPTDELYGKVRNYMFGGVAPVVVTSYATNMTQDFRANQPGRPGFAWFPRKFVVPEGWKAIHKAGNAGRVKGMPQHQELAVLVRCT